MGVAALPGQLRFYRVLKDYSWCEFRGSLHRCLFLSGMGRQGKRKLKGLVNEGGDSNCTHKSSGVDGKWTLDPTLPYGSYALKL